MNTLAFAFLACCSGAALGWSRLRNAKDYFSGWGFVGVYFLLILLDSTNQKNPQLSEPIIGGAVFALSYAGAMLWRLRLPVPVSAMLVCSQTLVWTLFAVGAWKLWRLVYPFDVLLIACWGTALFWLEWTLLPLWGTAQNFATSYPTNRVFIAGFGAAGGTWSVLVVCSWLHALNASRSSFSEVVFVIASAIVVFLVLFFIERNKQLFPPSPPTLRVATLGWAQSALDVDLEIHIAARQAAKEGAQLLVTPEAAIHISNRADFRVTLCTLAQKYNLALAIGYFDDTKNENCIDFVSSNGEVCGRYVKTHLVPMMERYNKGNGEIALMEVDGIKVGGVICQDDNFPDIARRYARAGTQLLVVPTNDWSRVKNIHFANHIWRALEFRFALARAASEGISALTSLDGTVETSSDHFQDGAKLLVADVRVGNGKPTFYAKTGDWFPIVCGLAAIVGLVFAPK